MEITLKSGRKIGDGHEPFIIAEVGSNWKTFEDCKDSIVKAKQCGADAVKFQLYDWHSLYGVNARDVHDGKSGYAFDTHTGKSWRHLDGALSAAWIPKLKEKADACGIEFMCSAFDPSYYDFIDPYVNIHKVASAECTHVRILEKIRDIGKPVILSTGASGYEDVKEALRILGDTPLILMYCVASYPAKDIYLTTIPLMKDPECFGTRLVGYSDHSTDAGVIPAAAVAAGACVIEKHFTAVEANTPDRPHSLNPEQFKRMVRSIRSHEGAFFGPTKSEEPFILRHNRRLIATRDIPEGAMLSEDENFGIYRSLKDDTHAFSPFLINEVNGRLAIRAIKAGDGIGPGDI